MATVKVEGILTKLQEFDGGVEMRMADSGHLCSIDRLFRDARQQAGLPKELVLYCARHEQIVNRLIGRNLIGRKPDFVALRIIVTTRHTICRQPVASWWQNPALDRRSGE